jgi:class 3 adenylate cyclase
LADLSGFSALAQDFAERGPRGAEDLKDLLNVVFGQLIDGVEAHGGEVLKFPGDAVLVLWPCDERDTSTAAHRAAHCALAAQQSLPSVGTAVGGRLQLRVGIGVGDVWAGSVGGVAGRWELLVAGEPLTQAVRAMSAVDSGEVALSADVWERVAFHGHATKLASGAVRLESLTVPSSPSPSDPIPLDNME